MSKVIQVRGVPDDAHRRLKARAAEEGRTLSDLVRAELVEIAHRPTLAELIRRIRERETVRVDEPAAKAIREERTAR
jgi:antitoxin FitA